VARTYKTLSLSLPPGVVAELAARGKPTGRVAARVAAEIVLKDVAQAAPREETRRLSWCCQQHVVPVQGPLVLIDRDRDLSREGVSVIVLLCKACKTQMHGREYEGWIADA